MKLLWSIKTYADPWPSPFEYEAPIIKHNDNIHLFYKDFGKICSVSDNGDIRVWTKVSKDTSLLLPNEWEYISNDNIDYLVCSDELFLNLETGVFEPNAPDSVAKEYTSIRVNQKNYESDSFEFDDYTIEHVGQWGYACKKGGKDLWVFKGRAYLYTYFMRYCNNLYFGTAGMGGYFYILNIETGEPLLSLKTGGTRRIAVKDNLCFIVTSTKKPELLCIDLSSGDILDRIVLPGKGELYGGIALIDGRIYAVTFEFDKRGVMLHAWFNCVELD